MGRFSPLKQLTSTKCWAQWVKRWPADLAVPSSSPARGEIFSTVNGVPLHTTCHYQSLIVLIWLKYCWKGRKVASHPSIYLVLNAHTFANNLQLLFLNRQKEKRKYMAGQGIEPGPLTLESNALPIASGGPAQQIGNGVLRWRYFFAHVKFSI